MDDLPIELEMFLKNHAFNSLLDMIDDDLDDDEDPDVVAVDTFFLDEDGEPNF